MKFAQLPQKANVRVPGTMECRVTKIYAVRLVAAYQKEHMVVRLAMYAALADKHLTMIRRVARI
jgi:hypothetical protein